MYTIKEIIGLTAVCEGDREAKLWLYLGDFLDYFYAKERTAEERYQLVEEEPDDYNCIDKQTYAFISGTVHKICDDYDVKRPAWIIKEKYFLKEPYFSLNAKGNLRLVLIAESPTEFRMRHIFTTANTLSRA